jgi:hypothetical protein
VLEERVGICKGVWGFNALYIPPTQTPPNQPTDLRILQRHHIGGAALGVEQRQLAKALAGAHARQLLALVCGSTGSFSVAWICVVPPPTCMHTHIFPVHFNSYPTSNASIISNITPKPPSLVKQVKAPDWTM